MIILNLYGLESVKKVISGIQSDNSDLPNLDLIIIELGDIEYFFETGEYSTHIKIIGGGSSRLGALAGEGPLWRSWSNYW